MCVGGEGKGCVLVYIGGGVYKGWGKGLSIRERKVVCMCMNRKD